MHKYSHPAAYYFMGVFMMFAALVYMSVISECWDLTKSTLAIRLFLGIPAFLLTIGGIASTTWSLRHWDTIHSLSQG